MFVVEYADGRKFEFSIDRWTLGLGEYATSIIVRQRQEMGDLPRGEIKTVRRGSLKSNDFDAHKNRDRLP
jgi:hypothetical protein